MIYTRPEFNNVSMLAIFGMEIEKQVVLLNDNLLALESQSAVENDDTENTKGTVQTLESLMRSAHSLKGAARIVGLDVAVKVAHVMEDCFVAIKRGQLTLSSDCADVLLAGIDWFTQLGQVKNDTQAAWLVQQAENTHQLVEQMSALLADAPTTSSTTPSIASSVQTEAKKVKTAEAETVKVEAVKAETLKAEAKEVKTAEAETVKAETVKERTIKASPIETIFDASHNNSAGNNFNGGRSHDKSTADLNPSHSDRVVKVNADSLNHLMALAGESLVEVNWLQPFADTMQHLKQRQQSLTDLLDQLQREVNLPSASRKKLETAKSVALDCHTLLSDRIGDLDKFSRRFSQLSDNLYREVIASHMRPFADGIQGFPRMVRDLAKAQGKRVTLEISGQTTQIDRDILDKLEAPLTHMLRNAIAHGIESPEQRQQLGKPETGTIRIEATHRAGMLSITVSDDGCGIEIAKLRRTVIQKQLTPPELAAKLSEAELMEFLFLPGFSTAEQVTEIAGRGVGLDIAKSMVQEVGGLLRALSKPGEGLSFHFQLPLTLSVIRALVVEISGEPYAFGLTRIDQVKLVSRKDIAISENRPYLVIDDENISLVKAQQVLELPETKRQNETTLPVVIVRDQGHSYGIVVDKLLGERELVVRPLDERFGKIQDVSAAALTEEGCLLLIIDVADLVCSIEQMGAGSDLTLLNDYSTGRSRKKQRVLVVDDSLTVREMERQLLQNHGYQVDVAVNGMEGWNTVRTGNYDLVISDIDMPRMNGIELVQHIKDHPQLKQLPVIIVSYKDRQADQLAGMNAGADYYLTKSSFQDNSLLTAVKDLID
ncbi:MAG: response regulator [Phormidesmis sp.]